MKEYTMFAMLLMAFLLVSPLAFAEENETSTIEVNEHDTRILSDSKGIELQILKLKEALEIKVNSAGIVLEKMSDKDANTTRADEIIAELESLQEEANALSSSDEEIAEKLVNLKEEAISLTKEFREIAREELDTTERADLAQSLSEIKSEIKNKYKDEKKELLRDLNRNRLHKFLLKLDVEDEVLKEKLTTLKQKLINKEITPAEALKKIRQRIKRLKPKDKKRIRRKLIEAKAKRKVKAKNIRDKARVRLKTFKEDLKVRVNKRIKERKNKIKSRIKLRGDLQ